MPATETEVEQLLAGALIGNAYEAFGLHYSLTRAQLEAECRIFQKAFHEDRGNATMISQIANACASVLTGKERCISECIREDARKLFRELMKTQRDRAERQESNSKDLPSDKAGRQESKADHFKAFFSNLAHDRVTSPKMMSRAEGLVNTFEVVPRVQATPHTTVRRVFMRVLNLTSVECGWLMEKLGLRRTTNSLNMKVTTTGQDGLKIPLNSECCECLCRTLLADLIPT